MSGAALLAARGWRCWRRRFACAAPTRRTPRPRRRRDEPPARPPTPARLPACLPACLPAFLPWAGRSWIEAPKDAGKRKDAEQCFLPKRHIHTWSGHSKGVNAIRWVWLGAWPGGWGAWCRACTGRAWLGGGLTSSQGHGWRCCQGRTEAAACAWPICLSPPPATPLPTRHPSPAASSPTPATCCCRRGWTGRSRSGMWGRTASACARTWGTPRCGPRPSQPYPPRCRHLRCPRCSLGSQKCVPACCCSTTTGPLPSQPYPPASCTTTTTSPTPLPPLGACLPACLPHAHPARRLA